MIAPDGQEIAHASICLYRVRLYKETVRDMRIGAMRPTDEETERYRNDVITLSALTQKWEREMEEAG